MQPVQLLHLSNRREAVRKMTACETFSTQAVTFYVDERYDLPTDLGSLLSVTGPAFAWLWALWRVEAGMSCCGEASSASGRSSSCSVIEAVSFHPQTMIGTLLAGCWRLAQAVIRIRDQPPLRNPFPGRGPEGDGRPSSLLPPVW